MLPSSLEILPRARNQLRIATWVLAAEGTSAGASGGGVNQNFCCPKTKTDFQFSPTTPSAAVVKSTMEVIGNVISGAKELYDSTNKANLSGAIDVVVVKQVSTYWHSIHPNRFIFDFFVSTNSLAQICWPLVRSSLFFSFHVGACDSIGLDARNPVALPLLRTWICCTMNTK